LNPIQAHYQAVLRPDVSDYSLLALALPNDFGESQSRDLSPRRPHYQAALRPEGRTIRRPVALAKFFSSATEGKETGTFDGPNRE
jgi:hypothetical protein